MPWIESSLRRIPRGLSADQKIMGNVSREGYEGCEGRRFLLRGLCVKRVSPPQPRDRAVAFVSCFYFHFGILHRGLSPFQFTPVPGTLQSTTAQRASRVAD